MSQTKLGKYIVIEGNDGTGKSTQVERLHNKLAQLNIDCIEVHEPAGTPIADELRKIIKNGALARDGLTNLLLFTAARRAIWLQQIQPALQSGAWVLSARSWLSTVAYQGYGEETELNLIKNITEQFTDSTYINPHLSVVLYTDDSTRQQRINGRGKLENPDTFESKSNDFQTRVNDGYQTIATLNHLPLIDASGSIESVETEIWKYVQPLTKEYRS